MSKFEEMNENEKAKMIRPVVFAIIGVLILIALALIAINIFLNYYKIYPNIYVNDTYVGRLSKEEAIEVLKTKYTDVYNNGVITFTNENLTKDVKVSEILPELDFTETVEKAYTCGRQGSIGERVSYGMNIATNVPNIKPIFKYDENRILQISEEFGSFIEDRATQTSYEISDDKLVVTMGKSGKDIDIDKLKNDIDEMVSKFQFGTINIATIDVIPAKVNVDELYEKYTTAPINASYTIEDSRLVVKNEVLGKTFDKEEYRDKLENLKELQKAEINFKFVSPEITEESLNTELFGDKLSSYTTSYSTGDVNRSGNIALASEKINNLILNPGDIFSYNDVVGERTAENGFKKAHVFSNGKIVDGYGGGICQVSSTLYNAVVLADLEVVSRTNHMFKVGYVPLSRDATVDYGTVDFKFKNNSQNPIKLSVLNNGGKITVDIYGVNSNPNRTIEIESQTLSSTPPKEIIIEDVDKGPDYRIVTQSGQTGYRSRAYKVIKENGVEVERILLSTDTYSALDRVIVRGAVPTPVEETQPEVPAWTETEQPVEYIEEVPAVEAVVEIQPEFIDDLM